MSLHAGDKTKVRGGGARERNAHSRGLNICSPRLAPGPGQPASQRERGRGRASVEQGRLAECLGSGGQPWTRALPATLVFMIPITFSLHQQIFSSPP